tara:strand:- start:895 stop:1767 length:873 start_codon:yes stop_codon:yes gene_type:complete
MRLILLILLISCNVYSQDIIVKQVWGEVEFIDQSAIQIVNRTILTGKSGNIALLSEGSRIWLRIGEQSTILSYQSDNNIFSLSELVNNKSPKNLLTPQSASELDKILSVLFTGEHHDNTEITGMIVGAYSGTSRSGLSNENIIIFDDININSGFAISLDWSEYVFNESDSNFNIAVYNKNHKIISRVITGLSFDMDINLESPFYNEMSIIVTSLNTDLILKGKLKGPNLFDNQLESLLSLKNLALKDLSVKNKLSHELFIDALVKFELNNSALYYLNLISVDKPTNYLYH